MASTMTDDEAICVAMLHSAVPIEKSSGAAGYWYIEVDGALHPIEKANYESCGDRGFKTAALLAHAYCKHYNIGW